MRRVLLALAVVLLPALAAAAPAYDAFSNSTTGTGTLSWTHTPTGTPRGVVVYVIQAVGTTNEVTAVTYGGVSMSASAATPVTVSTNAGAVYAYFLGASVPTGAQTVQVSVNGTGSSKRAYCWTVTASANTEIVDEDTISNTALANPSGTLTLGGRSSWASEVAWSGVNSTGTITELTGWSVGEEFDAGTEMAVTYRYNTVGTTNVTTGYTAAQESVAMIALAVGEVTGTTYNDSITETPSASESFATSATWPNSITETPSTADSLATTGTWPNALTEAVTAGESQATAATWPNALTEAVTAGESLADQLIPGGGGGTVYNDSVTESVTATESNAAGNVMAAAASEGATASDGLSTAMVLPAVALEAAGATDALATSATLAAAFAEAGAAVATVVSVAAEDLLRAPRLLLVMIRPALGLATSRPLVLVPTLRPVVSVRR